MSLSKAFLAATTDISKKSYIITIYIYIGDSILG